MINYEFMGNHPVLTFFLVLIILQTVVQVFARITNLIGVLVRGQPNVTQIIGDKE